MCVRLTYICISCIHQIAMTSTVSENYLMLFLGCIFPSHGELETRLQGLTCPQFPKTDIVNIHAGTTHKAHDAFSGKPSRFDLGLDPP